MKSLFELYDQLHVKKDFLIALTSNLDEFYSKKIEPKMKFGRRQENEVCCKLRHIVPPKRSLKIIQRRINKQLQKINLPDCMYGSIPKRSNVLNALQHVENKYFLTIDLKNFFSRINHNQVHSTFIDNGYCWKAARALTKLTTYQYRLPQGAPTSPVIANLAFKQTALQLCEVVKEQDIIFTTYLDDLTFSSKKDFSHLKPIILETLNANKFQPHSNKINYCEDTCDVTGLFVGNGKLKMHPEMIKEAKTNYRVKNYVEYVHECYRVYKLNKLK